MIHKLIVLTLRMLICLLSQIFSWISLSMSYYYTFAYSPEKKLYFFPYQTCSEFNQVVRLSHTVAIAIGTPVDGKCLGRSVSQPEFPFTELIIAWSLSHVTSLHYLMCRRSEVCVSFGTWNKFSYFYLLVSFRGPNQLTHTSLMSSFITSLNLLFGLCSRSPSCQLPPQHLYTHILALPPLDMFKPSHSGFWALSPNQLTCCATHSHAWSYHPHHSQIQISQRVDWHDSLAWWDILHLFGLVTFWRRALTVRPGGSDW